MLGNDVRHRLGWRGLCSYRALGKCVIRRSSTRIVRLWPQGGGLLLVHSVLPLGTADRQVSPRHETRLQEGGEGTLRPQHCTAGAGQVPETRVRTGGQLLGSPWRAHVHLCRHPQGTAFKAARERPPSGLPSLPGGPAAERWGQGRTLCGVAVPSSCALRTSDCPSARVSSPSSLTFQGSSVSPGVPAQACPCGFKLRSVSGRSPSSRRVFTVMK